MQTITLKYIEHNGKKQIGILFEKNNTLNQLVKTIKEVKWSQSHTCWYVPLNRSNFYTIQNICKDVAIVNTTLLLAHFSTTPSGSKAQTAANKTPPTNNRIYAINKHVLSAMQQQLQLKAYSPNTIKTYMNEMGAFLQTIKTHAADEFTTQRLKDYLQYCLVTLHLSENTLHSRMNAMKFYYEQVLKKEKLFWDIPRPKKPMQLPKLLNETELARLFNALSNKKHKAMLFTIYSAGLRVSELVHLKIKDIDTVRMQLFVERAKGKKDRYVNLSPILLDILRNYILTSKPRPTVYLFESEQTLTAYPTRTVQQIFINAKAKAGIFKNVGVHSLRHSFATHLLDKGTDIKYIKDLLGHFDIRTTERYLHVSKRQLVNIISPFDDLIKKGQVEW